MRQFTTIGGGQFHPERRLGCIGCPLQSQKSRREEFKEYPQLLKLQIERMQRHYDNGKGGKLKEVLGGNAWNFAYYMLWCDNIEDYIEKTTGLFPMEETPEQFVKRYFGIK